MNYIEIAAIIVFFVLLIVAIVFLLTFYICDNGKCKAFVCAEEKGGPKGSFDHLMALLGEVGNDGIWCLPYIGATIMTALVFWFLEVEFTVRTFAIMWFVCFVVNYILFSFYNHHYLKPLAKFMIKELHAGHGCTCKRHANDSDSAAAANIDESIDDQPQDKTQDEDQSMNNMDEHEVTESEEMVDTSEGVIIHNVAYNSFTSEHYHQPA